jgi:hypothetical protein
MWWLGSLPWAYWPTSPVMSAWARPVVRLLAAKRSSSAFSSAGGPPSRCIQPSTSWGTKKLYCQALASV